MKHIAIFGSLIACIAVLTLKSQKITENESTHLTFHHTAPINSALHRGALQFKKTVENMTRGRVFIDVVQSSSEPENSYAIQAIPVQDLQNTHPAFAVFDIPYLFENADLYNKHLHEEWGESFFKHLLHLEGVTYWSQGPVVLFSNQPLHHIHDISGLRFCAKNLETSEVQTLYLHTFFTPCEQTQSPQQFDIYELSTEAFDPHLHPKSHLNILRTQHKQDLHLIALNPTAFENITSDNKSIILKALKSTTSFLNSLHHSSSEKIRELEQKGAKITNIDKTFTKQWIQKFSGFYFRFQHHLTPIADMINPEILKAIQDPVTIGLNISFTEIAKDSALAIVRGAEIAVQDINKNGGFLGKKVIIDVRNHGGFPANGITNIESLAKHENVVSIIGGMHSPVVLKEASTIQQLKIPYLIPWAAASPIISEKNPYHFRFSVRDEYAGEVLFKKSIQKGQKVLMVLEETLWGKSNYKAIQETAQNHPHLIPEPFWFSWGEKSFRDLPTIIQKHKADTIIFVGNAPEAIHLLRKTEQIGKKISIVSHWGLLGGNFWENAKTSLEKISLSFLQTYFEPRTSENKRLLQFFQDYRSFYNKPNQVIPAPFATIHTYELLHMLKQAIHTSQSIKRSDIHKHLQNIKLYKGLIRDYKHPFQNPKKQDALHINDIHFATFDKNGAIIRD